MLAERGVAWVVSDTDEQPWDDEGLPGGTFAYLRLRRSVYDPEAIAAWGDRMGASLARGMDVFCFVKHEEALLSLLQARLTQDHAMLQMMESASNG